MADVPCSTQRVLLRARRSACSAQSSGSLESRRALDCCSDLTASQAAHQLCRVVLLAGGLSDAKEDAEAVHSVCVCARWPSQTSVTKTAGCKGVERTVLSYRKVSTTFPACLRPAELSLTAQKQKQQLQR